MECREYRGDRDGHAWGKELMINDLIVELWGLGSCLPVAATVSDGPFY